VGQIDALSFEIFYQLKLLFIYYMFHE